jgi:hypothetical protein
VANIRITTGFVFNDRPIDNARRQLVLCHASHGACLATRAFGQINNHGPLDRLGVASQGPLQVSLHADDGIFPSWISAHAVFSSLPHDLILFTKPKFIAELATQRDLQNESWNEALCSSANM